ncbi:MAG: phosphoribosylformylglycinamidine cyclo-ligase, partial [Candidatus Methanoperedens sp.]
YSNPFPYNTDTTIGDELLIPTMIYIKVLDAVNSFDIRGLAHITGSGLMKLHRVTKYGFDINDPLPPQAIFRFLQEEGEVDDLEMYKTFNMGMGFVVVLSQDEADEAAKILGGKIVGEIVDAGIFVKGLEIK